MRQEIELYLGGQSVEFNEPPEILFSYIRTDYTDPTVLRNSYSKTLTIEGTPNNNQIFNSIYHLDKISDYGTFNPAKRMEFQLFSNGDILEQGYAKLDKINKNGKNITYDITLYGGLGEFLYNLSYDQTAEGSDTSRGGGEDRRLSSLVFYDETEPNKEFDFDITKETVAEAWEALEKGTGATKWQYINFAPAYNGYPKDFDADKVLINTQGSSMPVTYNNNGTTGTTANATDKGGFPKTLTDGEQTYRTYNNYALGELPKEMTEWEMRDLRSYLQRPVMSIKGFMEAVSNPANNGGYTVELDQRFFNDNNPYYSKAWVTLPQLKKDEVEAGQSAKTEAANDVLSVSTKIGDSYDVKYYLQGLEPGAVYSDVEVSFQFSVDVSGMPNQLLTTAMDYNAGGWWRRDAGYYSSIFVQLIGEDENGNAIAGSPIYNFTTPYGNQESSTWSWIPIGNDWEGPQNNVCLRSFFGTAYTPTLLTEDELVKGRFVKTSGNHYVWKNVNGNVATLTAKLDNRMEYHRVYFRVTKVMKWRDMTDGDSPKHNKSEKKIFNGLVDSEEKRRNILMGWSGDSLVAKTAITQAEVVGSQVKYTVVSDVVRSGDHISKGQLLNFDGTPCDYLLSYCKLFNLYLSKDIYSKTIYIRTRDTFYNGGTIDLDQFIDRSKEIKVSPLAMESRWYDFAYPEEEQCGAAEDYDFNYGVEYGKNKVQTTYEFDSAAKNLFEDNIYQNGVEVQESSKYFTLRTVRYNPRATYGGIKTIPTFLYNSIDYKLFGESVDDTLSSCAILPPTGYTQTGYTSANGKEDWLPKLQLNNENDPIDGTNILCFYGGFKSSPYAGSQQVIYYLTDDVAEMFMVNGETPCWLWTKGEKNGDQQIAKGMTKLPVFSRMLYDYDKGQKTIQYTWDFGRVRNTYVPVKNYFEKSTIFERWWSNYIADLYDANTRVVEAYVKMEGKVVGDWLRAMYWWDNCYWVLTEINDYNITSYATTRCKFVKVNDIANYTSAITPPQPATPTATLVPSTYMIPASGGTITATVKTSDGGSWHLEYPSYVHPSQVAGTGDTQITLRFDSNPNSDGRDFDIRAYRTVGTSTHFWQEGTDSTDQRLIIDQWYFLISAGITLMTGISFTLSNKGSSVVTLESVADWITPGAITWNGEVATFNLSISGAPDDSTTRRGVVQLLIDGVLKRNIAVYQFPQYTTLNPNGDTKTLLFGFNPSAYTTALTTAGEWVSVAQTSSGPQITAGPNTSDRQRQTTLKVSFVPRYAATGRYYYAFTTIRQDGGGGTLTVSPTALTADYTGGDKVMTISADKTWTASSKPDWVTLSETTGTAGQRTIIVTFAENAGDSARTGSITITDGTRTATVNLTQNYHIQEYYFEVSPTALTWDYPGGAQYINVNSSERWTVSSFPAWVITSSISGNTGTSVLSVTARQNTSYTNDREGNLVLTNGTDTITIPLFQSRKPESEKITATPDSLYYDYTGSTRYINIFTDASWYLVSKPEWVILSQNGGAGSSLVTVTATENTGSTSRTGTIVISDGDSTTSIFIREVSSASPKTITVSPSISYVENTGGTAILDVIFENRNSDDVIITASENWLSAGYVMWSGDTGTLSVSVDNFGTQSSRTATITLKSILTPTLSTTGTIVQKMPPYINLSPNLIDFDYTGGTATLSLDSSIDWTIDIIDTTE